MSIELLNEAVSAGELRLFDLQFAKQMVACSTESSGREGEDELLLASALVSYKLSTGDTCVNLAQAHESGLFNNKEIKASLRKVPSLNKWRQLLLEQPVVQEVPELERGDLVDGISPLLLDTKNRLYLARYWYYEQSLMSSVQRLINSPQISADPELLSNLLQKLYPSSTTDDTDWQMVATAVAALNRFCVITGGPGTGKTYTVASLLAVFAAWPFEDVALRVMLAAPTGKAATRLTESLHASDIVPECYADVEAVTLHRLLRMTPGRIQPRYHSGNPLPADVLVVDEASMIDLPMMTRVLDAIPEHCRLILLGDKDQLASVESGMVLGDICGPHATTRLSNHASTRLNKEAGVKVAALDGPLNRISDHIVYLTKSHRANNDTGIVELSEAVNRGDVDGCLKYLTSADYPDLQLLEHSPSSLDSVISSYTVPVYREVMAAENPAVALSSMSGTCILCALRRGRSGADGINRRVEATLRRLEIVSAEETQYAGRPVMITENSPQQSLFNGDFGITTMDNGRLKVFFQGDTSLRAFVPGRLPQHETFYAMTVHKSQGSEYNTVVLVLPDNDSPLLTREMLYTGLTRARERIIVVANTKQIETAVQTRSRRQSGILDTLWPDRQPVTAARSKRMFDKKPQQAELKF